MAKLILATSYDPNFPPENVLSPSNKEFWITTGLFPQELLFQLKSPSTPIRLGLVTTNVRQVIVEGCEGSHLGTFSRIGENEFGSNSGGIQSESVDINAPRPINFLKIIFLSGWDEFISVHSVKIT